MTPAERQRLHKVLAMLRELMPTEFDFALLMMIPEQNGLHRANVMTNMDRSTLLQFIKQWEREVQGQFTKRS